MNESTSSSMPPTNRARLFTSQSSILLLKPHAHTVPHPPSLIANLVRTQPASSRIQEKRYAEPSRTSNSLSLSCFVSLSPDSTPVHDDATHTHTQRDQQPLPTTTTTTMKGLLRPTRPRLDATHAHTHSTGYTPRLTESCPSISRLSQPCNPKHTHPYPHSSTSFNPPPSLSLSVQSFFFTSRPSLSAISFH